MAVVDRLVSCIDVREAVVVADPKMDERLRQADPRDVLSVDRIDGAESCRGDEYEQQQPRAEAGATAVRGRAARSSAPTPGSGAASGSRREPAPAGGRADAERGPAPEAGAGSGTVESASGTSSAPPTSRPAVDAARPSSAPGAAIQRIASRPPRTRAGPSSPRTGRAGGGRVRTRREPGDHEQREEAPARRPPELVPELGGRRIEPPLAGPRNEGWKRWEIPNGSTGNWLTQSQALQGTASASTTVAAIASGRRCGLRLTSAAATKAASTKHSPSVRVRAAAPRKSVAAGSRPARSLRSHSARLATPSARKVGERDVGRAAEQTVEERRGGDDRQERSRQQDRVRRAAQERPGSADECDGEAEQLEVQHCAVERACEAEPDRLEGREQQRLLERAVGEVAEHGRCGMAEAVEGPGACVPARQRRPARAVRRPPVARRRGRRRR